MPVLVVYAYACMRRKSWRHFGMWWMPKIPTWPNCCSIPKQTWTRDPKWGAGRACLFVGSGSSIYCLLCHRDLRILWGTAMAKVAGFSIYHKITCAVILRLMIKLTLHTVTVDSVRRSCFGCQRRKDDSTSRRCWSRQRQTRNLNRYLNTKRPARIQRQSAYSVSLSLIVYIQIYQERNLWGFVWVFGKRANHVFSP